MMINYKGGFVNRVISYLCAMIGVLVGAMFLSGAGISYIGWYPMPLLLSKAVVSIATLSAFVKVFLFLSSFFKR